MSCISSPTMQVMGDPFNPKGYKAKGSSTPNPPYIFVVHGVALAGSGEGSCRWEMEASDVWKHWYITYFFTDDLLSF